MVTDCYDATEQQIFREGMRRLDAAGIDCFLPDLPGTLQPVWTALARPDSAWAARALEVRRDGRRAGYRADVRLEGDQRFGRRSVERA